MIEYITGYLIYISCILISYYFGKRTGVLKKFPVLALICIPSGSYLLMFSLGFCVMAAYMDIKNDMDVYDIYHLIPLIVIVVGLVNKVITRQTDISYIFNFYNLIPLLFTLATIKTRGFADTLALLVYSLLGIYYKVDSLIVICAFSFSYFIQIIIQCVYCKKENIKFSDKPKLAFLPALYIGNSIFLLLCCNGTV